MKKLMFLEFMLFLLATALIGSAQMGDMMEGQKSEMGHEQMMRAESLPEKGDEGIGAELFKRHCDGCHPKGGNIIMPNLPLKGSHVLENSETFIAFIRNPKMPDGSNGPMPSFDKSKISDEQAAELYHYIESSGELCGSKAK